MELSQDFTITTTHCKLRIPSERDILYVFSASRVSGFNDGMLWDPPATIEELQEPYKKSLAAWEQGMAYSFSIDSIASSNFVGRIAIRKTDRADVWDIGFWTHPNQQRRGFMSEAAAAVIKFGFEKLGAKRIESCHALWNVGSQKILEKIGMIFVKHIPEGFQKCGKWVPENLMAIDKKNWLNMQSIV